MTNKKTATLATIAAAIFLSAISASANKNETRWQEASREMQSLPFTQNFIDSVKRAHIGGRAPRGQRPLQYPLPPFTGGETLVYEVSWGIIGAGTFILRAEPVPNRGLIRLSSQAITGSLVPARYRTRDYAISWVDAQGLYPHFFEQHIREGPDGRRWSIDKYIVFDNRNGKLFYRRRGEAVEHESPPFTHDMVSIIYYARAMPLAPNATFTANFFSETDKETHPFTFRVSGRRESLRVGAGTFNTLHVRPTLVGEGKVMNKRDQMEIWISDDENRYPVRVKMSLGLGSITANLIQIQQR